MDVSYQLGPLMVTGSWIVLTAGIIAGFLTLTYLSPFKGDNWKGLREDTGSGIIYLIIIFIFGSVLFKIELFLSDPMAALSYPGGRKEMYLGIFVTGTYWTAVSIKRGLPVHKFLHASLYILLPAKIIYSFFEGRTGEAVTGLTAFSPWSHHPVSLYIMVVSSGLLLWLITGSFKQNSGKIVLVPFFIWTLSLLIINYTAVYPMFFGVPVSMAFYLVLLIAGSILIFINDLSLRRSFLKWKI
ncbi:hypothetical protein [Evansella clarkii]|uniref:hypothetical protein n=1 Tax=Evansella clarkii TaxID=79879 RepID=UPI000995E418|nr:hypothetical protein [Evansella clarkii]